MCLEKLAEIGIASAEEWASAMGYEYRASLNKVIRRIKEKYPNKIRIYYEKKPRKYEALIK
ncbi:MAG: hypothetical protein ACFFBH_09335 [Promethearchaeota archaeon]